MGASVIDPWVTWQASSSEKRRRGREGAVWVRCPCVGSGRAGSGGRGPQIG